MNGKTYFEPGESEIPVSRRSIRSAIDQLLVEADGTKRASTYPACRNDLRWFQDSIERRNVAQVTRADIIHLFSIGREEGLAQSSIDRCVQTAPTTPHPLHLHYGGGVADGHHLELCKGIAHRAGLNCGFCVLEDFEPDAGESTARARKRRAKTGKSSDAPRRKH